VIFGGVEKVGEELLVEAEEEAEERLVL